MSKAWVNKTLLLLVLFSCAPAKARAEFVVTPAVPEAYEPFTIKFIGLNTYANLLSNPFIDITEGRINIEYRSLDVDFGVPSGTTSSTAIQGLPQGEYALGLVRRFYAGELKTDTEPSTVKISGAPPTRTAYTFFHPGIKHYFVTAGEHERNLAMDNGWHSTDPGFKVWPANGPAAKAAKPVCRFYSALVNSHFFTASNNECQSLQSFDSGWTYEGIAFRALVPVNGTCPAGTAPIWRLYNDRFAQLDSNHRFVASSDTYRNMISAGWKGEGVAFCSPD